MNRLTENEQKVYDLLKSNSMLNENDAFDISQTGLERSHHLSGILSSLQKKGLIECWSDCYFDGRVIEKNSNQ